MRRCAAALSLLAALAFGGERELVDLRLVKEPTSRICGWVLDYDAEGIRFQRLGDSRKIRIPWKEIEGEDALALKRQLGIAPGESDGVQRVKAHRLHFKGGAVIEGLLLRVDDQQRHWVKADGVVMPFPGDQVARVEEIQLDETRIYDPHELYLRRFEKHPPKTAQEHADLAAYLLDVGAFEKARQHYLAAIEANPLMRPAVEPRLAEIDFYLADSGGAKAFRRARRKAYLDGDAEGAIGIVERFIETHPDFRRAGIRLVDEIRDRQATRRARAFTRVKHLEAERAIEDFLVRKAPDIDAAIEWVLERLAQEVQRRVRLRLGLSREEYEELSGRPATGAPHWATYWSGTFVVGKRTRGKGRKQPDKDRWWDSYTDLSKRTTFLKAYAAEHLDLFEVVQVNTHDCLRCGGRGQVRRLSFQSVGRPGQHEWWEVCPVCWGNRHERAVGYR